MFALPAAMKSGANLAYKRAGGGTQVPPPLSRGATGEEAAPMDIARSDGVVLLDVDREALGAGQLFAGGDLHVLVGDNAVQLHVGLDHGILH